MFCVFKILRLFSKSRDTYHRKATTPTALTKTMFCYYMQLTSGHIDFFCIYLNFLIILEGWFCILHKYAVFYMTKNTQTIRVKLTKCQLPQWLVLGERFLVLQTQVYQTCCTGVSMCLFPGRSQSHRFWSHLSGDTPSGYYQAERNENKNGIKKISARRIHANWTNQRAHFNVQMQDVHAVNVTNSFQNLLDEWLNLKNEKMQHLSRAIFARLKQLNKVN